MRLDSRADMFTWWLFIDVCITTNVNILADALSLCVDEQSEFLSSKIQEYIDLCVPLKTVTIGHRYVIREKWMTKGLLKSSLNLNKLRSKISKNN